MANNYLLFDQSIDNMISQNEYAADPQRMNGFSSGIARSAMFNKVLYQASSMIKVLGDVLATASGQDISDNDLTTLNEVMTEFLINSAGALSLTNTSVTTSNWTLESTPTFEGYPYKKDITVNGITSDWYANVIFAQSDAESGMFSKFVTTGTNYVRIYASQIPASSITIPSIVVYRMP